MKTLEQKLEQAGKLVDKLANVVDPIDHGRSDRYYYVLGIFQDTRAKLNRELDDRAKSKVFVVKENPMEEKRAIKEANVTSSTYERSKRILDKQASGWLTGRK